MRKRKLKLQDVFITENLSGGQINFLKCLAVVPQIKRFHGDKATKNDIFVAKNAREILANGR